MIKLNKHLFHEILAQSSIKLIQHGKKGNGITTYISDQSN